MNNVANLANLKMRADVWKHPTRGWAVTTYNPNNTRSALPTDFRPKRSAAINRAMELMKMDIIDEIQVYSLGHKRVKRIYTEDDLR